MVEYLTPTVPFDFQKMLLRPLSRPSKVTVLDPETVSYTRAMRLGAKIVWICRASKRDGKNISGREVSAC